LDILRQKTSLFSFIAGKTSIDINSHTHVII
jgi:hypothetical protein